MKCFQKSLDMSREVMKYVKISNQPPPNTKEYKYLYSITPAYAEYKDNFQHGPARDVSFENKFTYSQLKNIELANGPLKSYPDTNPNDSIYANRIFCSNENDTYLNLECYRNYIKQNFMNNKNFTFYFEEVSGTYYNYYNIFVNMNSNI